MASHTPSIRFAAIGGGISRVPPPLAKKKECKFFAKGNCRNGPNCPFLHRARIVRPSGGDDVGVNNDTVSGQCDRIERFGATCTAVPTDATHKWTGPASQTGVQGQVQRSNGFTAGGESMYSVEPAMQSDSGSEVISTVPPNEPIEREVEEKTSRRPKINNPCFEWEKKGECPRGDDCWYRHDAKLPAFNSVQDRENHDPPEELYASSADSDAAIKDAESQRRRRLKEMPCYAWAKGTCTRGDECWYEHDKEVEILRVISRVTREQEEKERQEKQAKQGRQYEEKERARMRGQELEQRLEREKCSRKRVEELQRLEAEQRQREEDEARERREQERRSLNERLDAERRAEQQERMRKEEECRRKEEWRTKREEIRLERQKKLEEQRIRKERQEEQKMAAERERRRREEELQERERRRKEGARMEREKKAEEAQATLQSVIQHSNLVTFAPGLQIGSFIPGFDLSCIVVRDLPSTATDNEIVGLFKEQGMEETQFKLIRKKTEGDIQTAKVLMQKDVALILGIGLDGLAFKDKFIKVDVGQYAVRGTMSLSDEKSARTLSMEWRLPSASMIAYYNTVDEARGMVGELNERTLRGRKLSAMMSAMPAGPAARHWVEASVKIMNLSLETEEGEVQEAARATRIWRLKPNAYDNDSFLDRLKALLVRDGPLEESFQTTVQNGVLMKATGVFSTRAGLEGAAASLKDGALGSPAPGSSPKLRVMVPNAYRYSINIPSRQHRAQKGQWDAMTESARGQGAFIKVKEGKNGRTYIELQGSDQNEVGIMKVRVEGLVAGEALEGGQFWHNSFMRQEDGETLFKRIFQETGAWIASDFKAHKLRAFGTGGSIALAKDLIRTEVDRLASTEREFPVSRRSMRFFLGDGLDVLKAITGEDNVSLDVAECKIKVRGGDDVLKRVRELVTKWSGCLPVSRQPGEAQYLCPICYDTPNVPETLHCDHSCCTACLQHYLVSALSSNNFPLVCMGNDATCNSPIPIPLIRRYLTPRQFNHLLDVAFTSYLQSNGRRFKYCTTPDCTAIYQCDTDTQFHQCPSCFSSICSSCHAEAHVGMTCEERRIQGDPAEQERLNEEWAKANNVQRCPSCKVLTEKISGCHHMTCEGCKAHWCWLCQGEFGSEAIYPHLTAVHGGFGL